MRLRIEARWPAMDSRPPHRQSMKIIHSAFAMLLLTSAALAQQVQESPHMLDRDSLRPLVQKGEIASELHGIWLSRGYGWLVEFGDKGNRIWHHGSAGTLPQDLNAAELFEGLSFELQESRLRTVGLPGLSTIYTWDRLSELPSACANPPKKDALSVFDFFWSLMDTHYAYFELRGIDWKARRELNRSRLSANSTDELLWQVLCDTLDGIGDDHIFLQGMVGGRDVNFSDGRSRALDPALEAAFEDQEVYTDFGQFQRQWFQRYDSNIEEELLGGEFGVEAQGQLTWGRLGELGYLNLRGMGGFGESEEPGNEVAAVHAVFSRVLEELEDCEGLIFDITLNSGGYDEVQLAIASHFTDERRLAFSKCALDVEGAAHQSFYLEPAEGTRFLKPVSLVTSDFTVSAGEDFTLAMSQLPQVTHRGAQTRGAFSDMLEKQLPNGWMLSLSNEGYFDTRGRNWEAKGVPPEDPIDVFVKGNLEFSHLEAIFAVADTMLAEE